MRSRRLTLIGIILVALIAPLSLGGLITAFVQARTHHHLSAGIDILLILWALLSVILVLIGFTTLIAGVFIGWRQRTKPALSMHKIDDSI